MISRALASEGAPASTTGSAISAETAPAIAAQGSMSCSRPRRSSTLKIAKLRLAPSASRLPRIVPTTRPPPTMTRTPASAAAMASAVARRSGSPSTRRPSSAPKKGEAPSMNVAFATVVWCSASTHPMKPPDSATPAATPFQPASRKARIRRPRWRSAMIRVSVSASASARNSTICQALAASIRRISRPPTLQNTPASATSTTPRA